MTFAQATVFVQHGDWSLFFQVHFFKHLPSATYKIVSCSRTNSRKEYDFMSLSQVSMFFQLCTKSSLANGLSTLCRRSASMGGPWNLAPLDLAPHRCKGPAGPDREKTPRWDHGQCFSGVSHRPRKCTGSQHYVRNSFLGLQNHLEGVQR